MRLTPTLFSIAPATPASWLTFLKAAQLQRIARATGIQSSGTKGDLIRRIEAELQLQLPVHNSQTSACTSASTLVPSQHGNGATVSGGNTGNTSHSHSHSHPSPRDQWSILSIDMGIQNLAFAHLRIPKSRSGEGSGAIPAMPELTAWRRLAVSEFAGLDLAQSVELGGRSMPSSSSSEQISPSPTPALGKDSPPPEDPTSASPPKKRKQKPPTPIAIPFSPPLYASHAYTLLTTLLSAYRPTHILIERQRFRSGGSSAVQEWTLRVGVFEGMLYAILHALRQERGGEFADVCVRGVEPKRVVRYWLDSDSEGGTRIGVEEKQKQKMNAREVKKAKIDLVGRWLLAASSSPRPGFAATAPKAVAAAREGDEVQKFILDEKQADVQNLAGAYLRKWKGQTQRTTTRASKNDEHEQPLTLGKLDDLADCLLQGVTWLEWQDMRERIARSGMGALE
ncbi:DNA-binding SAP [Penicillium riverlandense]|uniref:DNA-binding SAP n=1 Tax=Penicillium riverlandense TaxID=1903569 RepID=UPI0025478D7F|nr:DNA-binding SAP [Penicillium riverlandense]KAJ5812189.1 DNA-binding SAP [Penicillium riverlandense]